MIDRFISVTIIFFMALIFWAIYDSFILWFHGTSGHAYAQYFWLYSMICVLIVITQIKSIELSARLQDLCVYAMFVWTCMFAVISLFWLISVLIIGSPPARPWVLPISIALAIVVIGEEWLKAKQQS